MATISTPPLASPVKAAPAKDKDALKSVKGVGLTATASLAAVSVSLLLGLLLRLPWEPAVTFGVKRDTTHDGLEYPSEETHMHTRHDVYYPCSGVRCHAWLYLRKPGADLAGHPLADAASAASRELAAAAHYVGGKLLAHGAAPKTVLHVKEGTQLTVMVEDAKGHESEVLVENVSALNGTDAAGAHADAGADARRDGAAGDGKAASAASRRAVGSPVIVMAHGMGGTKDHKIDKFAAAFADAGYATFLFDYRFWGGSDGEPRHFLCPKKQVEDYSSAVQYIKDTRGLDGKVDPSRIVLWGTSYSGGHSLTTAAKLDGQIAAVVVMEPYLSPKSLRHRRAMAKVLHPLRSLRIFLVSLSDLLRATLGLPRAYLRFVADEGFDGLSLGRLSKDDFSLYNSTIPEKRLGGNHNVGLVRIFVWDLLTYNPSATLHRVSAPVLLLAGTEDDITPASSIEAGARQLPDARYVPLAGTHISLYTNPRLIPMQLAFLSEVVPVA